MSIVRYPSWTALGTFACLGLIGLGVAGTARAQTAPWTGSSSPLATEVLGVRTSASPLTAGGLSKPAFDTTTPHYATREGAGGAASTVVAEVDGRPITLGEVGDAIRGMPSSIAALPFEALFSAIVDQIVRREALAVRAQQLSLDADPTVRRRAKAAADLVLGNELLHREISATITEQALTERYERDHAGRPGPDEARVRVIMVPTESEATALIQELRAGADFAALARRASKDTTAPAGGDLGFMRQSDLNPEIGAVAFSLPVGQFNALPVRRAGSWFIVKVEARRQRQTPTFFAMRQQLLDAMVRERVPAMVTQLLGDVHIRKYDMNGNEPAVLKLASE